MLMSFPARKSVGLPSRKSWNGKQLAWLHPHHFPIPVYAMLAVSSSLTKPVTLLMNIPIYQHQTKLICWPIASIKEWNKGKVTGTGAVSRLPAGSHSAVDGIRCSGKGSLVQWEGIRPLGYTAGMCAVVSQCMNSPGVTRHAMPSGCQIAQI